MFTHYSDKNIMTTLHMCRSCEDHQHTTNALNDFGDICEIASYVDLFKDLRDSGMLDMSNDMHCACLTFCFMPLIQNELNNIMDHWNIHNVRKMKYVTVPTGKPDFCCTITQRSLVLVMYIVSQQLNIEVLDHCALLYASRTQVPDC